MFDSNGRIVYRVDNYNHKYRDEVYLMDSTGRVLFTIRRKVKHYFLRIIFKIVGQLVFRKLYIIRKSIKLFLSGLQKFRLIKFWEGFRAFSGRVNDEDKNQGFEVRKSCRILRCDSMCEVIVRLDRDQPCQHYRIESCPGISTFKIVDKLGRLITEVKLITVASMTECFKVLLIKWCCCMTMKQVKRKQTKSGVSLGEDVLTMVVEPHIDHSLVMGLVVVYSLINGTM